MLTLSEMFGLQVYFSYFKAKIRRHTAIWQGFLRKYRTKIVRQTSRTLCHFVTSLPSPFVSTADISPYYGNHPPRGESPVKKFLCNMTENMYPQRHFLRAQQIMCKSVRRALCGVALTQKDGKDVCKTGVER